MYFQAPGRFQYCGLVLLKAQGRLHCWPWPHEWGTVRTAGMWTMMLQLLYAEGYVPATDAIDVDSWMREITMHLVKSCVPAALQPPHKALWSPFLPSTQVSAATNHSFYYLPLQNKWTFKERLCASVQNFRDTPLHGFCAPGPMQESPQIPYQESLWEEGW